MRAFAALCSVDHVFWSVCGGQAAACCALLPVSCRAVSSKVGQACMSSTWLWPDLVPLSSGLHSLKATDLTHSAVVQLISATVRHLLLHRCHVYYLLSAGARAAACGIHSFAKTAAATGSSSSLRPYGAAMLMVAGAAMFGEAL